MTSKKSQCDVCGKNSLKPFGWHLIIPQKLNGRFIYLNFCSNECVGKYIEDNMSLMFRDLNLMDKRLKILEKRFKK
jgi:hypothetical protein